MYSLMFMKDSKQKEKDLNEMKKMFKGYKKDDLLNYIATNTKPGIKIVKNEGLDWFIQCNKNKSLIDLKSYAYQCYRRTIE